MGADVGRLTKERDKLMEISNRRKASLTKDMTEREEQHLSALEAAEKAGRETRRRYEQKVTQVETTITELVARNRELTDQIRMYEEQLEQTSTQRQPNSHRQEQKQRLEAGGVSARHRLSEAQER